MGERTLANLLRSPCLEDFCEYKRSGESLISHHSLSSPLVTPFTATFSLSLPHSLFHCHILSFTSTMKTTIAFALLLASFCLLECSNVPPASPSVGVVKPVIVEEVVHPAKPAVVLDANLVKNQIHQSWPLLCLVPKAYLLKPSLKLACPKFAVAATSEVIKKLGAQLPIRVDLRVTKPARQDLHVTKPVHQVPVVKH